MAIDLSKVQFPDAMTLREAALYLGVGESRVRALHRAGTLKADDTSGRLIFKKADLDVFKTSPKVRNARESANGKAFQIHIPGDKLAKVQKMLEAEGIKLEPRYNYAKMKEYQSKRKAALKAQAQAAIPTGTAEPVKK